MVKIFNTLSSRFSMRTLLTYQRHNNFVKFRILYKNYEFVVEKLVVNLIPSKIWIRLRLFAINFLHLFDKEYKR